MRFLVVVFIFVSLIQSDYWALAVPSQKVRKVMTIEEQNIALIENMFVDTAEKMDVNKIDVYFSPDFEMWSNDVHWDFKAYKDYHVKTFKGDRKATLIKRPLDDIFAKGDRVAARVTITLVDKNDQKKDIQVILIAQIKNKKIYRLWELTFPHWQ